MGCPAPGAEPICRVHVSDRGHFGFVHLDGAEEGVPALGYVAPARLIAQAIQAQLDRVDIFCPARLLGFHLQEDRVEVEVASGGESQLLSAALLVAADGGDSAIRQRWDLTPWSAAMATMPSSPPSPRTGPSLASPSSASRTRAPWPCCP